MTRNTYVLLAILITLVIVAYLVMQKPGEKSSTGESGQVFVTIDSLAVDRIQIKSPGGRVDLQKKGVEWYLDSPLSYKADQSNVATLIHDCKNLEVKTVVSDKPEKYSVFQVDSTGTWITLFEKGAEKASFILGKSGSSYAEMYARRSSSNDVNLLSGASSYVFNRPLKEWRDRTILAFPRQDIKEVKYQYGDTAFVLSQQDSTWLIGRDSTQNDVVNNLLSTLSNVQADDFVDTLNTRPSKPTAQISYAGTQLTFFYVKQGDKYLVQCSTSPQWFEVQSWRASQILKHKKEIVKSAR